jgi:hypothetical protein
MTEGENLKVTIERALAGDPDAGMEALRLCREGLDSNCLHPDLRDYLAERITEVLDGVAPPKALRVQRQRGRPAIPLPEWRLELGAFAALLTKRGYRPQQVAVAMCDQRQAVENKSLEEADAHSIRTELDGMPDWEERILEQLAGPYLEKLAEYPLRK